MRFMIMIKANGDSEAGKLPSTELLEAMGRYNQQLIDAGVMLAGEGLHPSSKGAQIKLSGEKRTVTDGPFAESKELIAGFWIIQAKSMAEAIEWAKRCPSPDEGQEAVLEVRQVFETEEFDDAFTPEQREREERQRAQIARNA
jgi:hypothetical protein